jgi:Ca2+-binding EF-hand superfamily protein
MSHNNEALRTAVDAIFVKYDKDKSGYLDIDEVLGLMNDVLKQINSNRQLTKNEVYQFVKAVDKSGDNKVQKSELF